MEHISDISKRTNYIKIQNQQNHDGLALYNTYFKRAIACALFKIYNFYVLYFNICSDISLNENAWLFFFISTRIENSRNERSVD